MRNKFTDTEIKKLLENMVILIDTGEKKNQHIIDYFIENNIKYKKEKIKYGDYTFKIEFNENTNKLIHKDIYFDKDLVIERKNSIDELAGNMKSTDRPRIKSEFSHINKYSIRSYIFVEDYLFDKHIREGYYKSQYSPKALYASLKAFEVEYDTIIRPISKDFIGSEMFNIFRCYAKYKFEKVGYIDL